MINCFVLDYGNAASRGGLRCCLPHAAFGRTYCSAQILVKTAPEVVYRVSYFWSGFDPNNPFRKKPECNGLKGYCFAWLRIAHVSKQLDRWCFCMSIWLSETQRSFVWYWCDLSRTVWVSVYQFATEASICFDINACKSIFPHAWYFLRILWGSKNTYRESISSERHMKAKNSLVSRSAGHTSCPHMFRALCAPACSIRTMVSFESVICVFGAWGYSCPFAATSPYSVEERKLTIIFLITGCCEHIL